MKFDANSIAAFWVWFRVIVGHFTAINMANAASEIVYKIRSVNLSQISNFLPNFWIGKVIIATYFFTLSWIVFSFARSYKNSINLTIVSASSGATVYKRVFEFYKFQKNSFSISPVYFESLPPDTPASAKLIRHKNPQKIIKKLIFAAINFWPNLSSQEI